jgi:hypothetical protein
MFDSRQGIIMFFLLSRSSSWRSVRNLFLKENSVCSACGSIRNLQVHHIVPFNVDKNKELDLTNLITLCRTCHFVFGHLMTWNSWNIDVVEDCKAYRYKVINRPYNIKNQSYNNNTILNFLYTLWNKLCLTNGLKKNQK